MGVSFSRERKWHAELARAGDVFVLKPQTFMNRSGESVAAVAAFHQIEPGACFIVFDDKDLPLGHMRLRERGSGGGHNGMRSVIAHLGTEAVPRLRFGIGPPEGRGDAVDHVLGRFSPDEREFVEKRLDRAVDAINYALRAGVARAMNVFNRNDDPPAPTPPPPAKSGITIAMKRKYEAVVVLSSRGSEDAINKLVSQIGRDIESEGAKLEQIDQIGRRKFAYAPRNIDEGYYVNFHFVVDPEKLGKVRNRLKLAQDIYMHHVQRLEA
jgi:PTH1 family peptidyl-tRNA hydrolase